MERVLAVYARPFDPRFPLVAMDEQPVQLVRETRKRIPASRNHPERVDYEYERAGTTNVFMFTEPLAGWRGALVCTRKTKVDWAVQTARVIREWYPNAVKVTLVCDNLNTHTPGAFYEAFPPEEARALVEKIEFCYTPKHGSWLNVAENELSAMTRQCVSHRRFATEEELASEITAWETRRNERQKGVDWQFSIDDARIKLKHLYPEILT